jgi:hypothetical protein
MSVDAMPFPEPMESDMQRIARGLREKDAALSIPSLTTPTSITVI